MAITINGSGGVTGLTALPDSAMSSGSIIQVVQFTTQTEVSNNGTTYQDTGLSQAITPTNANNKILVFVSQAYRLRNTTANTVGCDIRLIRGGTTLVQGPGNYGVWHQNGSGTVDIFNRMNYHYLDSPNTTDSTTYKTMHATYHSDHYIYSQPYASATASGTSYLTLMEVAA